MCRRVGRKSGVERDKGWPGERIWRSRLWGLLGSVIRLAETTGRSGLEAALVIAESTRLPSLRDCIWNSAIWNGYNMPRTIGSLETAFYSLARS